MLIIGLPTVLFWCIFLFQKVQGHDLNTIFSTVPQEISHDSACFTQGLVFKDNFLYESCGLFGKSSVRKVDISTGNVLKVTNVEDDQVFAEGLTEVNDILYMLTWKNKQVYMYDRHSLDLIGIRSIETYNGEGWGLTTDGKELIVSDGSDRLLFYALPDLTTDEPLVKLREVRVYDPVNQRYVTEVNELEYVNGHVFANLWKIDVIVDIDPVTGHILDQIELASLYPKELRGDPANDCLNGIAYHAKENYLFLTGKRWPKYYKFSDTEKTSEL